MILSISSKDLPYTIDTYQMFNGDSVEESETGYYAEEYGLAEDEQFSLSFDYDHKRIVEALAGSSLAIIEQALHGETDSPVIGVPIIKSSTSPQFYNYTTDSYTADWNINDELLHENAPDNWLELATENGWDSYDLENSDENRIVALLEIYLLSILSVDNYNMSMWECESEAYYENMMLDADSQKLIDSKERKS